MHAGASGMSYHLTSASHMRPAQRRQACEGLFAASPLRGKRRNMKNSRKRECSRQLLASG